MRIKEIWPVADIEGNESHGEEDESGLVNNKYKFRLRVFVAQKYRGELDQLDEDKDNAGDHPHVQTCHVWHAGNRSTNKLYSKV